LFYINYSSAAVTTFNVIAAGSSSARIVTNETATVYSSTEDRFHNFELYMYGTNFTAKLDGVTIATQDSIPNVSITHDSSDILHIKYNGGSELDVDVAAATAGYNVATTTTAAAALKAAIDAAITPATCTVTFNATTRKYTIDVGANTIEYIQTGSTGGANFGFTANIAAAASIEGSAVNAFNSAGAGQMIHPNLWAANPRFQLLTISGGTLTDSPPWMKIKNFIVAQPGIVNP
jgi:hypothetical protein